MKKLIILITLLVVSSVSFGDYTIINNFKDNFYIGKNIMSFEFSVELESFEVYNKNDINHIYWVTSTEINSDYFTLERSVDGKNWEVIAKIKGGDDLNTPSLYTFDDSSCVKGINYYRLTQRDYYDVNEIFKIISIKF